MLACRPLTQTIYLECAAIARRLETLLADRPRVEPALFAPKAEAARSNRAGWATCVVNWKLLPQQAIRLTALAKGCVAALGADGWPRRSIDRANSERRTEEFARANWPRNVEH